MSDPIRSASAPDAPPSADQTAKIEELLLAGLDEYFQRQPERAINLWTRVLFLDRNNARARSYLERARAAVAERQRHADELEHRAIEAFERGDLAVARRWFSEVIDRYGPNDLAFGYLDRLDAASGAGGHQNEPVADAQPASRVPAAVPSVPPPVSRRRRPAVVVLLWVLLTAAVAVSYRLEGASWRSLAHRLGFGPSELQRIDNDPAERAALPLPRSSELRLERAATLVRSGRLYEALDVLDTIDDTDDRYAAALALRAEIQERLLSGRAASRPAARSDVDQPR